MLFQTGKLPAIKSYKTPCSLIKNIESPTYNVCSRQQYFCVFEKNRQLHNSRVLRACSFSTALIKHFLAIQFTQ